MVFQNYALFPHLSAFHNIAYGLKVRRESQLKFGKKLKSGQEAFQFIKRQTSPAKRWSTPKGSFGSIIGSGPKIHLFDEPLGNLDPQFRTGMRRTCTHAQGKPTNHSLCNP